MHGRGLALVCSLSFFACSHGAAKPRGGPRALPVSLSTLEPLQVPRYDEYLASLTSRRSIELYPQVPAYVKAVVARPGEEVREGELLLQLDAGQELARLRSSKAALATKKANLAYAVKNDESSRELVKTGVLSELEYQQRHAARLAAEADVRQAEAEVAAQSRLLAFYRITAPGAGVVGDVPVKVGDYVTPQTELTSIDQNAMVEVYVYVPVGKVTEVTPETRVALLDQNGCEICRRKPTFVSQQVDPQTQSVLVKTICPNSGHLRESEVLKARLVWSEHEGLEVPVVALTRQAGQYFAFVAQKGPHGLVAQQKPIRVGGIQDNRYSVESGLSAGDRVVVSNVQLLHDGAPIVPLPSVAPASAGAGPGPCNPSASAAVDPPAASAQASATPKTD